MATHTTNLNLEKPDGTDSVSPTPFNNNFDILDEIIGDILEALDAISGEEI